MINDEEKRIEDEDGNNSKRIDNKRIKDDGNNVYNR